MQVRLRIGFLLAIVEHLSNYACEPEEIKVELLIFPHLVKDVLINTTQQSSSPLPMY